MLDALIFDVDGTVAETEDLHRRAFNLALARHGVDIAWDPREYRRLLQIHGGKERLQRSLAEHETPRSRDEIAAIHTTKTAIYESMLGAEGAPWRPGVARLMGEALRRGLRLAIATTTTAANLEPLFAPVIGRDWRRCFSAVLAGDMVAHKKPAPDIYRECVTRLGTRPQACIAFEDSGAGVASAREAGCYVVATRSEWLAGDYLGGAHLQVPHLGDPGRLWDQEHPFLHRRWLSIKDLAAWHARHEPDAGASRCAPLAGRLPRMLGTPA